MLTNPNQPLIDELGTLLETLEQTQKRIKSHKSSAVRQALSIKERSGMDKNALQRSMLHNVNEVMGLNEVADRLQEVESAILDAMQATVKEMDLSQIPISYHSLETESGDFWQGGKSYFIIKTSWGVEILVNTYFNGLTIERYNREGADNE